MTTVQNPFMGYAVIGDVAAEEPSQMTIQRRLALLGGLAILMTATAACAPTIRLQVDPIQIYAKLDADVRVRLDQELQDLLRENPNLF